MLWLDNKTEDVFYIELSNFLSPRGLDINTLTQIDYNIKTKRSDNDSNSVVSKTLGNGVDVVTGTTQVQISFVDTDFDTGALEVGSYYVGMRIKSPTMTDTLEIRLSDDRLSIRPSFYNGL